MLFHYPALMGGGSDITITISTNSTNVDVATLAINAGWNKDGKVTVIIDSDVYVYSTSTSGGAITVSGTFPNGVEIINNGCILGCGGMGSWGSDGSKSKIGSDGTAASCGRRPPGLPGGPALVLTTATTITNNGTIAGGGGGGGGGGSYNSNHGWDHGHGGSGGGGAPYGKSGTHDQTYSGTDATLTTPGSGGTGVANGGKHGGNGGAGGSWGKAGEDGTKSNGSESTNRNYGGAGGAAGAYVDGSSYATWKKTGTRIGNTV